MPLSVYCEGCQQEHRIRDQFAGYRIRCDCGHAQTVPPDAPSVPAATGLLDLPIVQVGSVGLVLMSMLVLGGVVTWVIGFDGRSGASEPASSAPTTTTKKQTPTTTKKQAKPPAKKQTDPEREDPQLLALLEELNASDLESNDRAVKRLQTLEESIQRRAIPALVAAVQRHDDEDFRQRAVQELVRLGSPLKKDYGCLKEAMRTPVLQPFVLSALRDLGENAREAIDVVVAAMKHRDAEIRRESFAAMKNLKAAARAQAFRLLLNPSGEEDEEASFEVLKTLLGEGSSLASEEIDVLAEALRDAKKRSRVRCLLVVHLGEGEPAARAIPALLDVLREKGDAKLLALAIKGLSRIGDKRKEVLAQLWTVATSAEEEEIRLQALQTLEQMDSSALSTAQIVERWPAENGSSVRQEFAKMLETRIARLKPTEMKTLLPLLQHKDGEIVLVGLKVVQARKEEAADVAAEVADLLKRDEARLREAALNALEALGSAVEKAVPNLSRRLLEHWSGEKDVAVRQALLNLLRSQFTMLQAEQMRRLLPLLQHKDSEIVLMGLKVVQARKEEAADVAAEVADLLKRDEARLREAALIALEALGSAVEKAVPNLSRRLLEHWSGEKDDAVQQALLNLLRSRLVRLKSEKLRAALLPLLRHKDTGMVLMGLRVVQIRKEEAADVAAEVAELLHRHEARKVREEALTAMQALGSAAVKALPKLFEILEEMTRYRRTPLILTIADMVRADDSKNVQRLVPYLLEGLHPKAHQDGAASAEAAISRILLKLGHPAVDAILEALLANLNGEAPGSKDSAHYRITLYQALAKLGPKCSSPGNYETLRGLWLRESKRRGNSDVTTAARAALTAMDPK